LFSNLVEEGGEKMQRNRLLSPDDLSSESEGEADAVTEVAQTGVDAAQAALSHAVGRYRELVAATPGLVSEMVRGDTIEEVDASVEAARLAYEAVSRHIAEQHAMRISTGNPARSSADLAAAALKPEAKIALGLRKF
jgi:hypothetical protein